ncbi:hypothetical protein AWC35_08355 [Gibbsiella quercinecans]|uniref:Uncharacterized protein n=1 Tax=Gibbsiella quercinecans TaxID=929813 RepID=A0A250AZH8_9GAMM|nr:hypothetical protein AWC35_08355 [Gibbsiella quercinecans]RLM13829.1 hypothetical protein BIY30_03410 [Gibbsiella quercinecans]
MFLNSANLKRDYRRFPRRHQIASSCSRSGDISRAAPSSQHKTQAKKNPPQRVLSTNETKGVITGL